jgi:molybdopterin-guanine dinucleotide biosynthesis protein
MLKIQVIGQSNVGKTTVATIIEKALRDHGIAVTNTDPDKTFGTDNINHQADRVVVIAKRSRAESVLLETVQVARMRTPYEQEPQ